MAGLRARVIPCLLLAGERLVKTVRFQRPAYVGDPINTVRIFNDLEVDELCFLDTRATLEHRQPNYRILEEIAAECFMPLAYGGGIRDVATARRVVGLGFEKIVVNSAAAERPELVAELARELGSQSLIASVDVKRGWWGRRAVYTHAGTRKSSRDLLEWVQELEAHGAGELLLTSIDREGTWEGYDLDTLREVTAAVGIPVIAHGGAGSLDDLTRAVRDAGACAVAAGSLVVFQKRGAGVLVNFPTGFCP